MGPAEFVLAMIQALAWPALCVFLFFALRRHLEDVLRGVTLKSLKVGMLQVDLNPVKAALQAGLAIGSSKSPAVETVESKSAAAEAVVKSINKVISKRSRRAAAPRRRILWVDDNPSNNLNLARSFQSLGYEVTTAQSTEEAVDLFREQAFDLVISDMGRPGDAEAGLTLLKAMQAERLRVPLVIFAANWAQAHNGEEARFGVAKITNSPSVLYSTVLTFMSGGSLSSVA